MFIVEVIPLSKSSFLDTLSYYSGQSYQVGTLLTIPVRNKTLRGMVVSVKPVSAAKTAVRAATFTLKKLPEQTNAVELPPILTEVAKQLTKTYPTSIGTALLALLPVEIREGEVTLESNLPCIGVYETPFVSVLQAREDERYQVYRSRIREAFAHRGSVLFVVPTAVQVDKAVELLSHGIENRIVTLSSQHSKKRRAQALRDFHDLSRSKLIITTPSHMFIDRHDITHMIVENSRSPYYKQRTRPYFDYRDVAKVMAKATGRQLMLGDLLPRPEEESLRREDIYQTESEHPKRIVFENKFEIIKQGDKVDGGGAFQLLSDRLVETLKETHRLKRHSFLFAARRGLAPLVLCADCNHIMRCPDSGAPYSLFRTMESGEEKRWFLCSASGSRIPASDVCPQCGSWRLRERGIGIQQISDELKKVLPKIPVILFDHTTATTNRKARQLMGEFYDTKGSLLLATSKVLPYLEKPVSLTAITSLDATKAIPTWRADEELLALLLEIREKTTEQILIQTRQEPDEIIDLARQGLVDQFYTEELALRQQLQYPPFSTFIHLSFQGSKETIATSEESIINILKKWNPSFYSGPESTVSKVTRFGLIRVISKDWPQAELTNALLALPPYVRIEINPNRII